MKAITEEKHEDLQNTDRKSLILENNENNKNSRQWNNLQDWNVDTNKSKKTNNQSFWPSETCAIVGDSMMSGIDEKPLSQKYDNVIVSQFSGERNEDTNHCIISIFKMQPDYLIIHGETNDAKPKTAKKIPENSLMPKSNISKKMTIFRIA